MDTTTKRACRIVAVIPCLNEEKHIRAVVRGALHHVNVVIVADDCSTDNTVKVAAASGAKAVTSKPFDSHGFGANVMRGLKAARKYRPDIIVLMDGDGQHYPGDIPKLLAPITIGNADIVMGNRNIGTGPAYRKLGNGVLSLVCNIGSKFKSVDAMTGFWAIKADCFPTLTESKWGMAIELLMKTRSNGHRIASVPVNKIYHADHNDNSTSFSLYLGIYLLGMLIKWRVKCRT